MKTKYIIQWNILRSITYCSKKNWIMLIIGKNKNPWKTFQALLDVRLATKKND